MKYINPNEYGGLTFDKNESNAVNEVLLASKIFRYADEIKNSISDKTERLFSNFFKIKYSLLINNGTSALKCALSSIDIKKGDRVLISAFTFVATAEAVIGLGGVPIPIDFDPRYCMNLEDLEREMINGCKAVIAVHIQGRAFDLNPIKKITKRNSVYLIEDACQAFGAKYRNTFAGCFGDIGVFSFQQNKQITSGEGGLLISKKYSLYKKARNYMDHGAVRKQKPTWDSNMALIGENCRITNIQSAVINIQLSKFANIRKLQFKSRNLIMDFIKSEKITNVQFSPDPNGDTGMNILFFVDSKNKADKIINISKNHSVLFRRLWAKPYYKHKVFCKLGYDSIVLRKKECENAITASQRLIALPIPPTLKYPRLNEIIKILAKLKKLKYIN